MATTILDHTGLKEEEQAALAAKPGANRGDEPTEQAPHISPEELEKRIQDALVDLVNQFEMESDTVRRHHVRKFLQAEEFWKGNQHLIWNERQFRWYTPFEKAIENAIDNDGSQPRFQYVNNLYQSWGLSIIAAISQRLPKVRFQPKSAKSERDIATAKCASDVMDVIERNNNLDMLSVRSGYLLWTQGLFGAYVRYVVDEEYGTHEEPVIEMSRVEIAPDRYLCPNCGNETPETLLVGMGPEDTMQCPDCGYALTDMDFRPAEPADIPVITGNKTYPNGQEKITLYGAIHLKMMPTAESQKETLYLILSDEQHKAALRAAYPGKAKKIGFTEAGAQDTMERNARLSLVDAPTGSGSGAGTTQAFSSMVTYKRAWLRQASFYNIDDDVVRDELLKRYPTGVRVALAGGEFLDAREENLDKHWRICRPMPGKGMYVEAVGASSIPIQQQYNDAQNLKAEHLEYGSAPPTLFDARYIKQTALQDKKMQPGQWLPVNPDGAGPNVSLESMVHQPTIKIDSNIYSHGNELIEIGQAISGAMPTIFGAPLKGNDTASGYSMAREQALGKLTLFWRSVKQFWAEMALISVECFKDNRTEDYENVISGKGAQYSAQYIHLEDLKGNITAHPEADEDFPASWSEIRENMMQLIKLAPEVASEILMHPSNAPMLRKFIANPELVLPAEDDREKQYREIDQMLQQKPNPVSFDPASGLPIEFDPSIMPDMWVDNHDAQILTAKEWAVSDAGIDQKKMNPAGYTNVMAHIVAHIKTKAAEERFMAQLQAMAAASAAPPPGGGGQQPQAEAGAGAQPQGKTVGEKVEEAIPGIGGVIDDLANTKVS